MKALKRVLAAIRTELRRGPLHVLKLAIQWIGVAIFGIVMLILALLYLANVIASFFGFGAPYY